MQKLDYSEVLEKIKENLLSDEIINLIEASRTKKAEALAPLLGLVIKSKSNY